MTIILQSAGDSVPLSSHMGTVTEFTRSQIHSIKHTNFTHQFLCSMLPHLQRKLEIKQKVTSLYSHYRRALLMGVCQTWRRSVPGRYPFLLIALETQSAETHLANRQWCWSFGWWWHFSFSLPSPHPPSLAIRQVWTNLNYNASRFKFLSYNSPSLTVQLSNQVLIKRCWITGSPWDFSSLLT